jgi:uncharacterized membrane protein
MHSRTERLLLALVGVNLALQLFDGVATYVGLRLGFGEGNRLVAWAIGRFGTAEALIALKLYASACVLAVWMLRRSALALPALALTATVYLFGSVAPWAAAFVRLMS